jgi:hypothetical protein
LLLVISTVGRLFAATAGVAKNSTRCVDLTTAGFFQPVFSYSSTVTTKLDLGAAGNSKNQKQKQHMKNTNKNPAETPVTAKLDCGAVGNSRNQNRK